MKRQRGISTETDLYQGTIVFAGDAAFPANNGVYVVDPAGPVLRHGITGGEVVLVAVPDQTGFTIPPGITFSATCTSIPGALTTILMIMIVNARAVPLNVPACALRYIILPK
jgi:hypothetical protein